MTLRTIVGRMSRLEIQHLWALAAVVSVFAICSTTPIWLGDFWWHLRIGEVIATTHRTPTTDSYSFVAQGHPYIYQQWLGELYLYGLYYLGGLELVILANALSIAAVTGIVITLSWQSSRSLRIASVITLFGLVAGLANRDVRPQVMGYLLFSLVYLILTRHRRGLPAPLWAIPLLTVVWANVHGSVVMAFALCAIYFFGELTATILPSLGRETRLSRRQLTALGLTTLAVPVAMSVNPLGLGIFGYIREIQNNPVIHTAVTEWFPPSIWTSTDLPFFAFLSVSVALLAHSWKRLDLVNTILFVAFAVLALQAVRNSIWFGIVAAPIAAREASAIVRSWQAPTPNRAAKNAKSAPRQNCVANGLIAALLLAIAFTSLPWVKPFIPLPPQLRSTIEAGTPVEAIKYAYQHFPKERFFHTATYGGYMIWKSEESPPVFVDGRVELYSVEMWEDYIRLSLAQDWEELLAKYGIRHVILEKRPPRGFQLRLLSAVRDSDQWRLEYEDGDAVIFARKASRP